MSTTRFSLAPVIRPFKALFVSDAREGILLICVAIAALAVANSALSHTYHEVFHGILAWTPIAKLNTLHLWINDGLMAIFFFVVGLEVKRELIAGNLADPAQRRLPVLAAAAGMAAPAAVYLLLAGGEPNLHRGWAIPAATDIAFAMGVIGLLGSRVPTSLRVFLLTVAIVDDIGAVAIIAIFYTANIKLAWLIASLGVLGVLLAMNRMRVDRIWPYVLMAVVLWYCVLNSGVHATIAGVVAALTVPMRRRDGNSLLENLEHGLVGWNAFLIVPLFGFANAGVNVSDLGLDGLLAPLSWHIGLDAEASRILNALYAGGTVSEEGLARLAALFRMEFLEEERLIATMRGKPAYLGLAVTAERRIRIKPQNLVANLPLEDIRQ